MKWYVALAVAWIALAAFMGGCGVQVCRDWAFICENTGSQKGYREWNSGRRSGHWYHESRLEQFMRKERPSELVNRWTSYAGTGKDILGQPTLFGHGRPGPILRVPPEFLDRYVAGLDDQAKLNLYRVFTSGPPEEIEREIAKVWERATAEVWPLKGERPRRK
jgi:hypothetical protein